MSTFFFQSLVAELPILITLIITLDRETNVANIEEFTEVSGLKFKTDPIEP